MKKLTLLFATTFVFLAHPAFALADDEVRTPISQIPHPSLFEITEFRETSTTPRSDLSHAEMGCYGMIAQAFADQYNAKDSKLQRALTGMGVQKVTFAFIEWPEKKSVQPEEKIGFRGSLDHGLHADQLLISVAVSKNGCADDLKATMALVMAQATTAASQLDARDALSRQADAKATADRERAARQLADDQVIANTALVGLNSVADSVAGSANSDKVAKPGDATSNVSAGSTSTGTTAKAKQPK